jgi:hypothetical protein
VLKKIELGFGIMAQVVKCLHREHKALSSNPVPKNKKKKNQVGL